MACIHISRDGFHGPSNNGLLATMLKLVANDCEDVRFCQKLRFISNFMGIVLEPDLSLFPFYQDFCSDRV